MVITIKNYWKQFCYVFNIYHYENLWISEKYRKDLLWISLIIILQLALVLWQKIPLVDEAGAGEKFYNWKDLNFYSYNFNYTEERTISNLILNSDSLSASTLADSAIGYQHNSKK